MPNMTYHESNYSLTNTYPMAIKTPTNIRIYYQEWLYNYVGLVGEKESFKSRDLHDVH